MCYQSPQAIAAVNDTFTLELPLVSSQKLCFPLLQYCCLTYLHTIATDLSGV